jgi:hypothetical protein
MKKICLFSLAALCAATILLSCEKEAPATGSAAHGTDVRSSNLTSLTVFKPNFVYTLAGKPENYNENSGKGDQAGFEEVSQLVADDGYLYALDRYGIRKINIVDSTVTTLAGGQFVAESKDGLKEKAGFSWPSSIALGPDGNLYVSDYISVRKVTKEGLVTTVAGSTSGHQDGPANIAKFNRLTSIAVCKDGTIYVIDDEDEEDSDHHQIRKISTSGMVSTLTSGGPSGPSSSWEFSSLAIGPNGTLYASNNGIFKISSKGQVSTVVKDIAVRNNSLLALQDGGFFICTLMNIQRVSSNGSVTVFAGKPFTDPFYGRPAEGPALSVALHWPKGLTLYNNTLYFAVHPLLEGVPTTPEQPDQYGEVIQMIPLPK